MTILNDCDFYFLEILWHLTSIRKAFVSVLKKLPSHTYKSRNCLKQQAPSGLGGEKSHMCGHLLKRQHMGEERGGAARHSQLSL